ncbi:MAG: hypothetical protein ACREJM_07860, partial [Candidatus Saccharimonadales bacterium]
SPDRGKPGSWRRIFNHITDVACQSRLGNSVPVRAGRPDVHPKFAERHGVRSLQTSNGTSITSIWHNP